MQVHDGGVGECVLGGFNCKGGECVDWLALTAGFPPDSQPQI